MVDSSPRDKSRSLTVAQVRKNLPALITINTCQAAATLANVAHGFAKAGRYVPPSGFYADLAAALCRRKK